MIAQKKSKKLIDKKVFLFDIDGTVALGNSLITGAAETIKYLQQTNRQVYFTTNNSTKSQQDYVDFFEQRGIHIKKENVITAGELTKLFCLDFLNKKKIFLMGTQALKDELQGVGINITEEYAEDVDCVLVAYDTTLNYKKLQTASRLLMNKKVLFIASNPDLCCPTDFGAVPDCGSICQMLTNATGREPKYLGKPYPDIVNYCRKMMNVPRKDMVLIGDRIYTDMACAQNAGIDGILVLTGEATKEAALNCGLLIPYVFEDIHNIYTILKEENKI